MCANDTLCNKYIVTNVSVFILHCIMDTKIVYRKKSNTISIVIYVYYYKLLLIFFFEIIGRKDVYKVTFDENTLDEKTWYSILYAKNRLMFNTNV